MKLTEIEKDIVSRIKYHAAAEKCSGGYIEWDFVDYVVFGSCAENIKKIGLERYTELFGWTVAILED